jgi:hypothetical protein
MRDVFFVLAVCVPAYLLLLAFVLFLLTGIGWGRK